MGRLGFDVTGLDSSATFVEIATAAAVEHGSKVRFRRGDAADMPFPDASFNRVLRPGGTVIIQDMDAETSPAAIGSEVAGMGLNRVNSWVTGRVLRRLRRRAYSRSQMESLISRSAFGTGTVTTGGISLDVRLAKP